LKRKILTIIIILLFIETSIIPLGTSEQIRSKTIITVDDEPGDADYIWVSSRTKDAYVLIG
jgi:hypothetical protein